MIASYRDPRYAASVRLEQLQDQLGDLGDQIPAEIRTIHARRSGRIAAGVVAVAGFILVAASSLAAALTPYGTEPPVHPTHVLLASVIGSLAMYGIGRAVARRSLDREVCESLDPSGDALAAVARLESNEARRAAVRIAARGERGSLGWPLAGLGVLAPLTMHLVVWGALEGSERSWLIKFDWWIGATLILVGFAHLMVVYQAWRFARNVSDLPTGRFVYPNPVSGWKALFWIVLASCVPGIIAFAIPPVLVLVTGLIFIPLSWRFMYRRAHEERYALENA